jgi:hypothetical protein
MQHTEVLDATLVLAHDRAWVYRFDCSCKRTHIGMHGEMEPEYCNRTATRSEQNRTEQESRGAGNSENPLDKRKFRQNRTQKEARNLTDKEEVPGSSPGRPTRGKARSYGPN